MKMVCQDLSRDISLSTIWLGKYYFYYSRNFCTMKQQTVLVTGASSGIGKGVAQYFLDRGDNVIISSLTKDKLEKVFLELGGGGNLAMVVGDITLKETSEQMVRVAVEKFGSVDVLVHSAGIFEGKPFLDVDKAYLDRLIDISLKAPFYTMQSAIAQMVKQKYGVVINIGTSLDKHAIVEMSHSAQVVGKAGVNSFTVHLAAEFGKYNIRVNTVAPGVIRTPMHQGRADEQAGIHVLNRVAEVDDIAAMVFTIAKSDFTTGAIIYVDGGLSSIHSIGK